MSLPLTAGSNERYLEASLAWVRARLRDLAPRPQPLAIPIAPRVAVGRGRLLGNLWGVDRAGPTAAPEGSPALLTPQAGAGESFESAAAERAAAAAGEPTPALIALAQAFHLTDFERDVILLCAAAELDPKVGPLIREIQGREAPTFGLALSALDGSYWEALSATSPLRAARLVEVGSPGTGPFTASPLRIDERVLGFLKGANALDDRLVALAREITAGSARVAPSQQEAVTRIEASALAARERGTFPLLQLVGNDPAGKLAVAAAAAERFGVRLLSLEASALPTSVSELDEFARLWMRETVLLPLALYLDAEEIDGAPPETRAALARFLSKEPGLVFVGVREPLAKPGAVAFDVEVARPTMEERRAAWTAAIGDEEEAGKLAAQFDLDLSDVDRIVVQAKDVDGGNPWDACRRFARPRLEALAQRLDARATWDDLILPAEQEAQMRAIVGQIRSRHRVYGEWGFGARMNRGMGISALFAGESGTGKTMAAEVIANELGLDLYRIDLSAVVSKYIGETEKKLRELFDAAERGGAILFFDEADALFGKRSEVRDSHDRYANIQVDYLLQRLEAFSGFAILATNMKSAIDPAFLRRLRFVVTFPFPGQAERKRMWERALPRDTPQDGIVFDRLARLSATGANIQSIALNAAFLAADAGGPVTMAHLVDSSRMEFRKLERPFTEAEFR